MMKSLIFASLLIYMILAQCASRKIYYAYPAGLSTERRDELDEKLARGKKIFRKFCAQCHGVFGKGVDSIPNFTQEKLDSYTSGFIRGDMKNHAFAMQLNEQQLSDALIFGLLVRKKTPAD